MTLFEETLAQARSEGRPLIAVHRGVRAGIVMANTAQAGIAGKLSGADIIELDVARTTDGQYLTFHDGYEHLLLDEEHNLQELDSEYIAKLDYAKFQGDSCGHVEYYRDVLANLPNTLVNVDRADRYWKYGFLDELATWANPENLLIKSKPKAEYLKIAGEHPVKFPYMPMVRTVEEIEQVLAQPGLNLIGFEVLARTVDDPLADTEYLASLREQGYLLWMNAINLENPDPLYCHYDDNTSIFDDPDKGWGKMLQIGVDIIQTDWPWLVKQYVTSKASR